MTDKIQLTNIGGQALPVIQGIMEFDCDINYLLHSIESEQTAIKIADILEGNFQIRSIGNANDFNKILTKIDEIVAENREAEFFVNVSGGTKIMTLALFTYFVNSKLNSTVFHIDQNGIIHFLNEIRSNPLKTVFPIDRFIAYSGQKIKSKIRNDDIPNEYFDVKNQTKKIYKDHFVEFRILLNRYRELNRKENNFEDFDIVNRKSYSQLKWSNKEKELSLSLLRKYRGEYVQYTFNGSEYLGIVLETKWFELELVEIFRGWDKTKELAWSVIVPYIEGSDKNEIDIIVNVGNKLLFVECKTQLYEIKDIDKLRNASKTYGGLGSKSILITYFEPNKRTIEKCKDNNILLFSFTNPDKSFNSKFDLYKLLNNEIQKSNTF